MFRSRGYGNTSRPRWTRTRFDLHPLRCRLSLTLDELRLRAERLLARATEERYRAEAGLKTRPELAAVYESEPLLDISCAMPVVERRLAEATGDEERRLRYLLEWLGSRHIAQARAALDDELYAWESTTTLDVEGSELPLTGIPGLLQNTDRAMALQLEERRNQELDEVTPLLLDRNYRVRQAAEGLGYGRYVEASSRVAGFSLRALARQARHVLDETEDAFHELLAYHLGRWLDLLPAGALRSDMSRLRRMEWLDDEFKTEEVLAAAERDLSAQSIPLEAEGRVTLDLEARPLKRARAFFAAVRVPSQVMVCLSPAGGRADCQGLLRALGGGLHAAYTSPELPFEYRCLGDGSLPRAFGRVFARLASLRPWVRMRTGLVGEGLDEYLRLAAFLDLQALRRDAATLIYELELAESDHPTELRLRYAESMGAATGVRYDARTFLEHAEGDFAAGRRLRGWMLGAILSAELRDRYDEDWFRNPRAGLFLRELFEQGASENAGELAERFGSRLDPEPLLASLGGQLD